jgi:hypothetical protein
MKPDWFVLVQEWTRQGYSDRGITLAFLVGALALRDGTSFSESSFNGIGTFGTRKAY